MDDNTVARIFAIGYQAGIIDLAHELGLISENITEKAAIKQYGKKQIQEWREKRWIVGYPTGNKERSKVYFKRSELEIASRMLDLQNVIPPTRIKQIIEDSKNV
jgi:hypothetical protein